MADSRLHHSRFGVLCTISPDLRELIDDYGFFHIVLGSDFEATLSYVAYVRSSEVDWFHSSLAIPFYHYYWMNGKVVTLPERTISVRRSRRTVLEKKQAEDVFFHPVAGETSDSNSAKAGALFREADGTVTVDPTDFIPMDEIVHAGVGGRR